LGGKLIIKKNFTILWPDLRGHGVDPPVKWTSFGAYDSDDLLAALDYLRTLKSEHQKKLVGDSFGVFGVELGAYSAMKATYNDPQIKVLVVDSVPASATDLLNQAISNCVGLENGIVQSLSRGAVKIYLFGEFD